MALIHKFKQGDNFFVLDVNTGAVHIVDELVYDLVDDNKLRDKEELIKEFGAKYGEETISEAYEELLELIDEDILYSRDQYEDIAHSSMDDRDYIKAVCLNIIHGCNLRCKYCFADEGEYNGHKGVMSVETAKKAIDYVVKRSGPRKNIEIETELAENVFACADAELLSLVWNNLFSNAFKFTDDGGKVTLKLTADEEYATVKISDTGCGMTADVGAHIFEKFYQGDTSHATQGNGLGLALVKRVVDIVQGEIGVESAVGVGTTFTVKIRRAENEPKETR